jgi:hypothetical protein
MTDAVPAPVVLAVLGTLSVDLRSALVLDAAGTVLAGDASLAAPARALLDGARARAARSGPHGAERLYVARSNRHALALAVGPHALEAVVVHDLLAALTDLGDC